MPIISYRHEGKPSPCEESSEGPHGSAGVTVLHSRPSTQFLTPGSVCLRHSIPSAILPASRSGDYPSDLFFCECAFCFFSSTQLKQLRKAGPQHRQSCHEPQLTRSKESRGLRARSWSESCSQGLETVQTAESSEWSRALEAG